MFNTSVHYINSKYMREDKRKSLIFHPSAQELIKAKPNAEMVELLNLYQSITFY